MAEKVKKSKKKVIILSILAAVVAIIAVFIAVVAIKSQQMKNDKIAGNWCVVYRMVDENGDAYNEFVSGEYVEFTSDSFIFYSNNGGTSYSKKFETKVTYGDGSVTYYRFTLPDKSGDTEYILNFSDNYAIMSNSASSKQFLVLVRCDKLGDTPITSGSAEGNWKRGSTSLEIKPGFINSMTCTVDNYNGITVYKTDSHIYAVMSVSNEELTVLHIWNSVGSIETYKAE